MERLNHGKYQKVWNRQVNRKEKTTTFDLVGKKKVEIFIL